MTTPAPRTGPGGSGAPMYARVGDEIVVRGTTAGVVTRDGEVVGVHHADGSPPYDVRWTDNGRVSLYFPGPDAYVRHLAHQSVPADAPPEALSAPSGHEPGGDHVHAE
ncbi:DUF1918 domain-containing protein [Streptomyces sp. NPDC016566]|uniref:DUF1918 domain-containing protein n=1 Tax=unclassified Streptomyces TaxID=2593676 RepID=UPI0011ABDE6F|nr:DUF1918 domain-containing protein [Streptomyces sp. BK340]TVZ91738.1 uncharacterized protein DUF1918 [Streptomyces sp. BK340]